jgi:hypothetical protein
LICCTFLFIISNAGRACKPQPPRRELPLPARRFVKRPNDLLDRHAAGLREVRSVKNREREDARAVVFPTGLPFVFVDTLLYLDRFPNINEAVILFSIAMDGVDAETVLDLARVGVWAFKCVVTDGDTHMSFSFLMCPPLTFKGSVLSGTLYLHNLPKFSIRNIDDFLNDPFPHFV